MKAVSSGLSESATQSEGYQAAVAYGQALAKDMGITEQLGHEQYATIGVGAAFGLGVSLGGGMFFGKDGGKGGGNGVELGAEPKGSGSGQLTTQIASAAKLTDSQAQLLSERFSASLDNTRQQGANFLSTMAKETRNTDQETFSKSMGLTNSDSYTRSASVLLSSANRFNASETLQKSAGIAGNLTHNQIPRMVRDTGMQGRLNEFFQNYGSQGGDQSLNQLAERYANQLKARDPVLGRAGQEDNLRTAARVFALANGGFLEGIEDDGLKESIALEASNILGGITGVVGPQQGGHNANAGIGAEAKTRTEEVRETVEGRTPGSGLDPKKLEGDVTTGMSGIQKEANGADPSAQHHKNVQDVKDGEADMRGEFGSERAAFMEDRVLRASKMNDETIESLSPIAGIMGNFTPKTLRDEGAWHVFSGASNLDAILKNYGLETGLKRDDFMAMSPEERQEVIVNTHERLAQGLRSHGVHDHAADYLASLILPEAMTKIYSDGGGFLGGWQDYSEQDIRYEAHMAGREVGLEAHDRLYQGLLESTGSNAAAAMVMSDLAKSGAVLVNLGSSEAGDITAKMINTSMGAAGYEGIYDWKPGSGGPGANWPERMSYYNKSGG